MGSCARFLRAQRVTKNRAPLDMVRAVHIRLGHARKQNGGTLLHSSGARKSTVDLAVAEAEAKNAMLTKCRR